jgi:signal transduction histidine kinase
MLTTEAAADGEQAFVLSNRPPTRAQKRLGVGIVLGLVIALLLVIGPFGGMQLGAIHSFVAMYTAAMFVTELITAVLLYAQFSVLRSRAILVIASGYLFTALLIVPYVLAFPGVLAPNGLIGGLQTTAHIYLIWHCSFPLLVIAYTLLKDRDASTRPLQRKGSREILRSVVLTVVGATAVGLLCVMGGSGLPPIMLDANRFVANWPYVVGAPIGLLCGTALVVLWLRRRSVLDLFLMVVLCAYLIEIPPHWYPAPARFSTGWYAVRVTSLISSCVVLIVLLYEITALYGSLLAAMLSRRREREARLMTGDAVAASIAHEVRQPLTAMITTADAGLRFLDRSAPNLDRAKEAFKRISSDGHRAGDVLGSIRANFKSDAGDWVALDVPQLVQDVLALGRGDLQRHRIVVRAESSEKVPPVTGNRIQLQQVLLNLIVNAIDAMAERGEPRVLTLRFEACDGDSVALSVADTGHGIGPREAERIFSPLFTTKSDGMGMGLAICRSIIEAHQGRLWFTPNNPHGAVFHISLPAKSSPPAGA